MGESLKHEFSQFTLDDMTVFGVWTPNDDLDKKDLMKIADTFYKKYPANYNDCGVIDGVEVGCELKGNTLRFTCYWGQTPDNIRLKVAKEIISILNETIYSVVGDDTHIKNMINNI